MSSSLEHTYEKRVTTSESNHLDKYFTNLHDAQFTVEVVTDKLGRKTWQCEKKHLSYARQHKEHSDALEDARMTLQRINGEDNRLERFLGPSLQLVLDCQASALPTIEDLKARRLPAHLAEESGKGSKREFSSHESSAAQINSTSVSKRQRTTTLLPGTETSIPTSTNHDAGDQVTSTSVSPP